MENLLCVVLLLGILGVDSAYYNCTADQYKYDRVTDCSMEVAVALNVLDVPDDCSAIRVALDDFDSCVDDSTLGCTDYYIDEYKFSFQNYYLRDERRVNCSGTGDFEEPGVDCYSNGAVFQCGDAFNATYFSLDPLHQFFCIDLNDAYDMYTQCVATAASNCSLESLSGVQYDFGFYFVNDDNAENCTSPDDPSFDCANDVITNSCYQTFEDANMTITRLVPEDYCTELITAVDDWHQCIYSETLELGCREEYLNELEFADRTAVVDICGGRSCFLNQALDTGISTTCLNTIVADTSSFTSQSPHNASECSDFYALITQARLCLEEVMLNYGCLYSFNLPYDDLVAAELEYGKYCGFINDTCTSKISECEVLAATLQEEIDLGVSCSGLASQLQDLDWCDIEAASVGRCSKTEIDAYQQGYDFWTNITTSCSNSAEFCGQVPIHEIKGYCVEVLQYSMESLADAIPTSDDKGFCANFGEEILEQQTGCIIDELTAASCPPEYESQAASLTGYYDYLVEIVCNSNSGSGVVDDIAVCSSPANVMNGVLKCGYGVKSEVTALVNNITDDNMEENCVEIDDLLTEVSTCLNGYMVTEGCEAKLNDVYAVIEIHAYPDDSVCDAVTSTESTTAAATDAPSGNNNGGGVIQMSAGLVAMATLTVFLPHMV